MTEWAGTAWRLWRIGYGDTLATPRLVNPWENSGLEFKWEPSRVEVARCFMAAVMGIRCAGLLSAKCTCGIRSMATLEDLAAFWAAHPNLESRPWRSAVVGRVRIGGKIQHRIPGLPPRKGYNRSELAEIVGPLYVSPFASRYPWMADALAEEYAGVEVVGPDLIEAAGPGEWLHKLADMTTPAGSGPTGV